MEERLAVVWAVCRFPASRSSVDTDLAGRPVVLVASAAVARAAAAAAACASVRTLFESAIPAFAMRETHRSSARRCAVVDSVGASAGILSAPSLANVDSARRDPA